LALPDRRIRGRQDGGDRLLDPIVDQRVDELTRAGLLSRDKKGKRVGLLTKIPRHVLVTISDFSTVATMADHEARARMYGMLRVVYDAASTAALAERSRATATNSNGAGI
jgi:hypothetical protein